MPSPPHPTGSTPASGRWQTSRGAPAPALHRRDAARDAGRPGRRRRHPLPRQLREDWPPQLSGADERGWFRFQRLYDIADRCRGPSATCAGSSTRPSPMRQPKDRAGWRSRSTRPAAQPASTGWSVHRTRARRRGYRVRNPWRRRRPRRRRGRTRHEQDSRTLARLAARFAGRGVVGFGLSNDERRAPAAAFAHAFGIARRAGLLLTPHGGELLGAESVRECLEVLGADRLGHGVHAADDVEVLDAVVERADRSRAVSGQQRLARRVSQRGRRPAPPAVRRRCPHSTRRRRPPAVRARLVAQYAIARHDHDFTDADLARLAKGSFAASTAPTEIRAAAEADIDAWLAASSSARDRLRQPSAGPPGPAPVGRADQPPPVRPGGRRRALRRGAHGCGVCALGFPRHHR